MPREYARRSVATWKDKDFRALDLAHQGLFDALCAYPGISWCGVIDYLPKRLTECSEGLSESKLVRMVGTLRDRRFLCLDPATDELLVRTFIRHDGVLKMLNVGKSMAAAYKKVHSPYLQSVIVNELGKLWMDDPKMQGWKGVAAVDPGLYDEVRGVGSDNPMFETSAKG